ncbi:hypothetical protein NPIL_413201 [Nephila pilipes]|uniref:Uncharacterized protein n=1 Tax=Nephila pilipes TaxID=299642 RepID=A0A8X6NJJ6_NEPPI|nr:hypothetical protein NPIL_413201 [Nephila pilipes]
MEAMDSNYSCLLFKMQSTISRIIIPLDFYQSFCYSVIRCCIHYPCSFIRLLFISCKHKCFAYLVCDA